MTADLPKGAPLPPRLRRVLELAYGVEGVVSTRVWQWPGRVAIGIRCGQSTSPTDVLRRVEMAVAGLREPGENWDFGLLDDETGPEDTVPKSRIV